MIKDITIGQYVPGDSFIHKLDSRVKILISLIYVIDLFLVSNIKGYMFIITFTIIAIIISKIHIRYIYKGLKPIFILIVFTAALNIFMTPGKELIWQYKFINIYKEGLNIAGFMVIRLIFLIVGTSILTLNNITYWTYRWNWKVIKSN